MNIITIVIYFIMLSPIKAFIRAANLVKTKTVRFHDLKIGRNTKHFATLEDIQMKNFEAVFAYFWAHCTI